MFKKMKKYVVHESNKCKCCDEPLICSNCIYCDIHMFISETYLKEFIIECIREINQIS